MKEQKTNVMRLLDQKKIPYKKHSYSCGGEPPDGVTVASLLGEPPGKVFKTLVCQGADKAWLVFVIPADKELDLKKAARASGEKSVALIHVKELLPLTGYVRGGCSPIGMKKLFPTFFDRSAEHQETVLVSAGKIGLQTELSPQDLARLTQGVFADLTKDA